VATSQNPQHSSYKCYVVLVGTLKTLDNILIGAMGYLWGEYF